MKAVVYIRVSTTEQVENFSLETQRRACVEYCAREGIEVEKVFSDQGESAKSVDRPELQRLLAYCQKHWKQIAYVVVYDVSRFSRNTLDHLLLRASLKKLGISLRAATQQFDDSSTGELVEFLLSGLAHFDNRQRADRTIAGMRAAVEQGRWVHQPPLGYAKPAHGKGDPSLAPDPERAVLIRRAFEEVSAGRRSRREVLDEMTALGLRSRSGAPLSLQSFGNLLRNPIYTGRIRLPLWNFEGPGDFEPLVSLDVFDAVQCVLEGRRRSRERRYRDHPDFPLRRFVRCKRCGGPLTGSWSKGRSRRYAYYRCSNRECRSVNISRDTIEDLFLRELEHLSVRPEVLALFSEIVRDAWKQRNADLLDRQEQLKGRLNDLTKRKNRVVDAFLHDGRLDEETYREQKDRIDQEMAAVRAQIDAVKPDRIDVERLLRFAPGVLTDPSRCWKELTPEQRPGFQQAVYPNGLLFDGEGFGTAQSSWAFTYLRGRIGRNEGLASPTGIEPVLPP